MTEDFEIIENVKKGNKDAFDDLVFKYQDRLYNIAYRMLNDLEEAKDITQETFLHAYMHINEFRGESSVYYWLTTILMNLCRNKLKKWEKEHRRETVSLEVRVESENGSVFVHEIPDPSISALEQLEKEEREKLIQKALDKLPTEYKTVILLHDFDELSYEVISQICKCPIGTVRSRLHRARAMLKEILKRNLEK
jgi:RNA polymerase sigma-70 factor (ECF subfamily)